MMHAEATCTKTPAATQTSNARKLCSQCPLHFTMQRLAHTAVQQLVLYADGEYVPRPNLLDDLQRWQRLHTLIAAKICPASRHAATTEHDLHAAQALIPEAQFTALRETLSLCAACGQGDSCPLDATPELELFDAW